MSLALKNFTKALILVLLSVLLSASLWAQSTTDGAIGGTVADPQNAVVPGAVVTVHNNATDQDIAITTDNAGYYRVIHLQPTTYTVTVQAKGFAPYKAEQVIVTVGSLTNVSPKLTIGTTEQVDVTGEAPLVNVDSADFAPVMNEVAVENLPINGGRWSSFSMLTPGVVSDSNGFGLVSARGMSPLLNNVTVDGADNNQAYFSEERGRTRAGYSTPKIAVQEFQVNTSNYSTEYGRAAGAVINTVTKSGTNQIHGEGYWEDRDNDWGATNPFTTLTKAVYGNGDSNPPTSTVTSRYKPVDVRKMGGFSLGGPIIKDKLFWFVAYDRYHRNFPGTAVPNSATTFFAVPDAALPTGKTCATAPTTADQNVCTMAGYLYGSANNTANYNNAATLWMNAMYGNPSTNQLGLMSITGPTARKGDQDIFFPKVDWIVNPKNHAFFELNRMRWWSPAGIQTQATNSYGTKSFGDDYVKTTWGVAKLDTAITNTISNQVRFQYGRDFEFEYNQNPTDYEKQTLLNPNSISTTSPYTLTPTGYTNPYGIVPNVYIGSFQWGTAPFLNRAAYPDEYKTQIADTVSMQYGKHNLKFGLDFMKSDDKIHNLYTQYGEFSYGSVAAYFADLYNPSLKKYGTYYQAFQGTNINNPVQSYEINTKDWGVFAQDDWKVFRRLTVNLGFRYETEVMPDAFSGLTNTFTMGTQTITAGKLPDRPNNFGPRIGFAWDTFGDGKTVVRGGYGIYFGRIINSTLYTGMTTTGSTAGQNAYTLYNNTTPAACSPTFAGILTDVSACNASVSVDYFDRHFKSPQIHEIDLSLQREIGWGTVVSVSYLGSFGRHMQSFTDGNMAAPGSAYCAVTSSGAAASYTVANCPTAPVNGVAYSVLTPPSTITYTLSNQVNGNYIGRMPLAQGSTYTVPFYTSRLTSQYGSVVDIFSGINSSYNAMVFQLEKRMSNHVQFAMNYTWSHALDYGVNGTTGVGSNALIDPRNVAYPGTYGNSNYNVPNRLTFNSVMQSPWHATGWKKYLIEDWQMSPVVQIQAGLPYSVTNYTSKPVMFVGTQKYTGIASGMLGTGGSSQVPFTERNGYRQPNTYVFDLRLSKGFKVRERYNFEFTTDIFNLFNHDNVTGVSTTSAYQMNNPASGTAGTTTNPTLGPNSGSYTGVVGSQTSLFGVPSSGNSNFVYSPRQLQMGVRVTF